MTKQAKPEKRGTRRPLAVTQAMQDTFCERIAAGGSIKSICAALNVAESTMYLELSHNAEFSERYARARVTQADIWAQEIIDIADDSRGDFVQRVGKDGELEVVVDQENIQRSRLRVDTRKWLMARLHPRRYGERVEAAITGPGGGAVQVEHSAAALPALQAFATKLAAITGPARNDDAGWTNDGEGSKNPGLEQDAA